ncbi:MAG: phosphate/phosphite/phosphonate ABC transporter substrate-binding protein [Cyanobacteria bacterium CRU_2_1]|nr:phosphate/phosphite/phosphonate ABC transporter substrate-binding protein [Cyanobacteria bacterium RU_5_0]NJR63226.1 phosphate/phosphite/phosphonate ABC transporter substrate-binding protein [Cyanobacteria bacterium CRU_2_1]
MLSRRFILVQIFCLIGFLVVGCNSQESSSGINELTIGVVSYDEGAVSLQKYERLRDYLAEQTKSIVQLEPAYNELQAVEQIKRKNWEIVFAPPGLAAIAIDKELYVPLFSLEEIDSIRRAVIIVRADSPAQTLIDLNNTVIAVGEPGSAAGYYLPIYDLYGLILAEIRSAPTPKTALEWIDNGSVNAGAMSAEDFERYRRDFPATEFRNLHTSRWIPPGVVLLGPTVDRNLQEQIERVMRDAPPDIIGDAGYVPTASIPDYSQFIELVNKVLPLREQVKQKPAILLYEGDPATGQEVLEKPTSYEPGIKVGN